MKKLLCAAAFLFLSTLAVAALRPDAPALARGPAAQQDALESRVSSLETELAAERRRHEETRALLDQTLAYLEKQSQAAQALLLVLDESEQQGFAVGENWRSRQTLLAGMRAYWGDQQGVPKPATPPAPKPAAPTRPARK